MSNQSSVELIPVCMNLVALDETTCRSMEVARDRASNLCCCCEPKSTVEMDPRFELTPVVAAEKAPKRVQVQSPTPLRI